MKKIEKNLLIGASKSMCKIGLISFLCSVGLTIHGMHNENEWIGIQKYWNSSMYHSNIYKHCARAVHDQNCAVINAYFLLIAQEKQIAQKQVNSDKMRLTTIEQKISNATNSNFIQRRKLEEEKRILSFTVERSEKHLQQIAKQIKLANLSEDPYDNVSQKKLEYVFNQLIPSQQPSEHILFELQCIKVTENNAKRRRRPFRILS